MNGILIASGFIAGEALVGLVTAWFNYKYGKLPEIFSKGSPLFDARFFHRDPSYAAGLGVLFLLALVLVKVPIDNAGSPDEPAPPTAIM